MDTQIVIRDGGPYGPGLSLPAAIARLCDGGLVTVTAIGPPRQTATRAASHGTGSTSPSTPPARHTGSNSPRRSTGPASAPAPQPTPPCSRRP